MTRSGHGKLADWWSLGALMFDMLTGTVNNIVRLSYEYHNFNLLIYMFTFKPLFRVDSTDSTEDTIENILTRDLEIPLYVSIEASDLFNKLLEVSKKPTCDNLIHVCLYNTNFIIHVKHIYTNKNIRWKF